MSYWLDDDDNNNNNNESTSNKVCPNCGAVDQFYHDATSGRDVCQECNTESQQLLTQEAIENSQSMEFDQVMNQAARTRGGVLMMSRKRNRDGASSSSSAHMRKPLPEYDKSVPFPDLDTCLEGFQTVLQACSRQTARHIRKLLYPPGVKEANDNDDDSGRDLEKSLVDTVGHLWIAYLRAFADGAAHYHAQCPELRISLRDAFVTYSPAHRYMLMSTVIHKAAHKARKEQQQANDAKRSADNTEQDKDNDPPIKNHAKHHASAVIEEEDYKEGQNDTASLEKEVHPEKSKRRKVASTKVKRNIKSFSTPPLSQLINASTGSSNREGYKEAALKIKPSMEFAASMIWLAVCESGLVTSYDFVDWIAQGHIPLLSAFDTVLTAELQAKLRPLRSFFRLTAIPSPHCLETNATILAVACRMRARDAYGVFATKPNHRMLCGQGRKKKKEELYFWSSAGLPMVVTRLVARAGLSETILHRSLALLNLSGWNKKTQQLPKPLARAKPEYMTRNEDILAVIAIACQMDETWRSKHFLRPRHRVAYTEDQLSSLDNDALTGYLDFAEEHFMDSSTSVLWSSFGDGPLVHSDTCSLGLNEESNEEEKESAPTVVPCNIIAGQSLVDSNYKTKPEAAATNWIGSSNSEEDARRTILIEYLAYSANANPCRIRESMEYLLQSDESLL